MKIISNKDWQDYQEWLNSSIEYTVKDNWCDVCGEPLFFDKEGTCAECEYERDIEDLYNDNEILHDILDDHKRVQEIMKEKIADLEDANDLLDDMVYDDLAPSVRMLGDDNKELWEELDKLTDIVKNMSGDFTMLQSRLDAQKLINKIIEESLCEIRKFVNMDMCGSTTKPKPAKGKSARSVE